MFIQDHRIFRERLARIQCRARAHALDRKRRECGQPAPDLCRRVGRRRFIVDRHRSIGARDPPQCEHAVFDRKQRRLRARPRDSSRPPPTSAPRQSVATSIQSPPIDPVLLALTLGATFVARSFSGDKAQLVPLIQAGMRHNGFALIDVLSPCVTFNDHEGSTKSYTFTREHYHAAVETDFVPPAQGRSPWTIRRARRFPSACTTAAGSFCGSSTLLRSDRQDARPITTSRPSSKHGEYVTGLIHIDETDTTEFHTSTGLHRRRSTASPTRSSRRAGTRSTSSWRGIGSAGGAPYGCKRLTDQGVSTP